MHRPQADVVYSYVVESPSAHMGWARGKGRRSYVIFVTALNVTSQILRPRTPTRKDEGVCQPKQCQALNCPEIGHSLDELRQRASPEG